MQAIMSPESDYSTMRHEVNKYALWLFILSIIQLVAFWVTFDMFGRAGEKLVRKIKYILLRHMLRMDSAFYDKLSLKKIPSPRLLEFLSGETTQLRSLSGTTLVQIEISCVTLVIGVFVALGVEWRLGLVCTACIPILLGCGFSKFRVLSRFQTRAQEAYESSGLYACESIACIAAVKSLNRERSVVRQYYDEIESQVHRSRRTIIREVVLFSMIQGLPPLCMALTFWYGSKLLFEQKIDMYQFFVAFMATMNGTQAAGIVFSFAPDIRKAKQAFNNITDLLDQIPEIDACSFDGMQLERSAIKGKLGFFNVGYDTTEGPAALLEINFKTGAGSFVGIVGSKGSGKSLILQLIEGLIRPSQGIIELDGIDVSQINVSSYRRHIGYVCTEIEMFPGTLRNNLVLGNEDWSEQQIIEACQKADMHDFISSLPQGYDTEVGTDVVLRPRHMALIALARALLRDPPVLLIDDICCGLDAEETRQVQSVIDTVTVGRTTLMASSTIGPIRKASLVLVLNRGKIAESGTHSQLEESRGRYYEMLKQELGSGNKNYQSSS